MVLKQNTNDSSQILTKVYFVLHMFSWPPLSIVPDIIRFCCAIADRINRATTSPSTACRYMTFSGLSVNDEWLRSDSIQIVGP